MYLITSIVTQKTDIQNSFLKTLSVPSKNGICGGSLNLTHIALGTTPDIRTVCRPIIGAD